MNPTNSIPVNGQSVGVSPANQINDPKFTNRQGSNTFDLSYQNLLTARYGEITPFFYMSAVGRDRIRLNSAHQLRTYTLGAPLMSSIRMRKSIFSVSRKAMMPNSYNYLFVNPVKGNDVPDDAYCKIDICGLVEPYMRFSPASSYSASDVLKLYRGFLVLNLIFSKGSLLDYLGISTNGIWQSLVDTDLLVKSIDDYAESFVSFLSSDSTDLSLTYSVADPSTSETQESVITLDGTKSTAREFFLMSMQHPDFALSGSSLQQMWNFFASFFSEVNHSLVSSFPTLEINLYKVIAYQMIVSQFYSNDHVDNVYNSDLWLSNMKALIYDCLEFSGDDPSSEIQFTYNGIPVFYDVFSAHLLNYANEICDSGFYFICNLFAYRRSLRYGDYFLSSRPLPLAVGDVNVPVVGNNVSVIDINKNLHIQRFLNAVNRVGSTIAEYAKGIFGYTPSEDDARPRFISSEVNFIGSDDVENTAENQGEINTNLIATQSNYMFDVDMYDESVILGLVSFECTSAYPQAIERDNFHVTRYDDFIPELQHIGDQIVYKAERTGIPNIVNPFGYQVRYAEYKFKYNQMHGGFTTDALKLWAFPVVTDISPILDEDSIRSTPAEFDRFYKSLTYGSMANYFHFQISFANNVTANRAMDYQPTLI